MIQLKGIDHIVLRVKNLDDMIRFYCDVLGCQVERKTSPGFGLAQLRAGDALIDLVSVDSELGRVGGAAPGKEGRNMDHFCVQLASFEETSIRTHLSLFGVQGSELANRYGAEGLGPSIYIQDPEGNTIELKGPPNQGVKV
jgi:catechol 2,3-dioxygenase-like lactoylglutathione lyase family enzyme